MSDGSAIQTIGTDFGWVDETLCEALMHQHKLLTDRQFTIANDLDARLDAHGSATTVSKSELSVVRQIETKLRRADT